MTSLARFEFGLCFVRAALPRAMEVKELTPLDKGDGGLCRLLL